MDLKQNQQQNQIQKKLINDDGNLWGYKLKNDVIITDDKKRIILKKIEVVKNILLERKIIKTEKQFLDYKEYNDLYDYDKYCILSTNYWHVMGSNKFINVPIENTRFWFYFDVRCFDLCFSFQKRKKEENDELLKYQSEHQLPNIDNLVKENVNVELIETEFKDTFVEPESVIELKPEPIIEPKTEPKTTSEMPIEENKDFLNEKQEHPIYPKRDVIPDVIINKKAQKAEAEEKQNADKKTKKTNKKNNDEGQGSLF